MIEGRRARIDDHTIPETTSDFFKDAGLSFQDGKIDRHGTEVKVKHYFWKRNRSKDRKATGEDYSVAFSEDYRGAWYYISQMFWGHPNPLNENKWEPGLVKWFIFFVAAILGSVFFFRSVEVSAVVWELFGVGVLSFSVFFTLTWLSDVVEYKVLHHISIAGVNQIIAIDPDKEDLNERLIKIRQDADLWETYEIPMLWWEYRMRNKGNLKVPDGNGGEAVICNWLDVKSATALGPFEEEYSNHLYISLWEPFNFDPIGTEEQQKDIEKQIAKGTISMEDAEYATRIMQASQRHLEAARHGIEVTNKVLGKKIFRLHNKKNKTTLAYIAGMEGYSRDTIEEFKTDRTLFRKNRKKITDNLNQIKYAEFGRIDLNMRKAEMMDDELSSTISRFAIQFRGSPESIKKGAVAGEVAQDVLFKQWLQNKKDMDQQTKESMWSELFGEQYPG